MAGQDAWKPIAAALLTAIVVATAGALITDLGPWYVNLKKPSWQPPDWLFGPAWTLIFGLDALAAVLAWRGARTPADERRIIILFAINLTLNVLWSALFFRLHRPDWALGEVGFLLLSVAALVLGLRPMSRLASALILPYLAWVGFASFLNWTIVQINPPFAS